MGERQPFRFRIPWLMSSRPTEPPRPRPPTNLAPAPTPSPPTTTQKTPFRPAGIAPTQRPTSQPQQAPRIQPQPPPASRPPSQSDNTAKPLASLSPYRVSAKPESPKSPFNLTPKQDSNSSCESTKHTTPSPPPSRSASKSSFSSSSRASASRVRQPKTEEVSPQLKSPSKMEEPLQPISGSSQKERKLSVQESEPKKQIGKETVIDSALDEKSPAMIMQVKEIREQRKDSKVQLTRDEKKDRNDEDHSTRRSRPLVAAPRDYGAAVSNPSNATLLRVQEIKKDKQESPEKKTILPVSDQIKTMTREINSGSPSSLNKEIKEDVAKLADKLASGKSNNKTLDEKPVSVVTVAGENRGAYMHLGSDYSPKNGDGSVHIRRGYKTNPDESPDVTIDGEGSSKHKKSIAKEINSEEEEEKSINAYINSNMQSANNSILFHSSLNERDPGVHFILCQNRTEQAKNSPKPERVETRKAEVSLTKAEKVTHQPRVRRRCLRGLFLEPSDSDPDNPDKPKRHGCRVRCGEKNKDLDVL